MATHTYGLVNIDENNLSLFDNIFFNIIDGGTTLFLFISGFLFHHVFFPKYQFKKFIIGKTKNVLIPYTILSLPMIFYYLNGNGWAPYFVNDASGIFEEYIIPLTKYYWSGIVLVGYWYIPFIMIMFLLSPLHFEFAKLNVRYQTCFILLFLILSCIIGRPIIFDDVTKNVFQNTLQSVVYFFPVYLIGITCSINKQKIYDILVNKEFYLLFIVIILAFYQVSDVTNSFNNMKLNLLIDVVLFQKLILSIFLLVWLHRFEQTSIKILEFVAAISFSIFFLHGYVIIILEKIFIRSNFQLLSTFSFSVVFKLIFISLFLITIISLIVVIIKKLFKSYSRYLIGT